MGAKDWRRRNAGVWNNLDKIVKDDKSVLQ